MGKKDDFNLKKRKKAYRLEKKSFLILCEGKNTEIIYFKTFRLQRAHLHAIKIEHGNSETFIKKCIEYKSKLKEKYDFYWIVLDKDDNSEQIFNSAIELASKNHFQVAYSNQAFELWFILHFQIQKAPLDKSKYKELLSKLLGFEYEKDEKTCVKICKELNKNLDNAIQNAEYVYKGFSEPRNPAKEESSTTVYKLMKGIKKYLQ